MCQFKHTDSLVQSRTVNYRENTEHCLGQDSNSRCQSPSLMTEPPRQLAQLGESANLVTSEQQENTEHKREIGRERRGRWSCERSKGERESESESRAPEASCVFSPNNKLAFEGVFPTSTGVAVNTHEYRERRQKPKSLVYVRSVYCSSLSSRPNPRRVYPILNNTPGDCGH